MKTKSVLITGAGTGIGKETAKKLVSKGHKVYATTYSEDEAKSLQKELGEGGTAFKLDITNAEDRLKIKYLEIDVLINNAAIAESGSLAEIDIDRVRNIFNVNLFSSLELTQIAIKKMIENGGGTVIFLSSIVGRVPAPFLMPYSMTKFAISAAAAGLRKEMKVLDKGIHVSVVEPGPYKTGFNQKLTNSRFEWMEKGSIFSEEQMKKMKADTDRELRLAEFGSLSSIVKAIVKAAEAKKPKLRYVAPWQFAILVRLMRIFGV